MKVYAEQNDNLDALIYRHFGTSEGILEPTLELNPHLAHLPHLPLGCEVILPEIESSQRTKADSIQLWD